MRELPIFQVDAFSSAVFAGNPAAVVALEGVTLSDALMQAIAAENNLSETAFLEWGKTEHGLRWFTPEVEVDLCGHATLASAFVAFTTRATTNEVVFVSPKSGRLPVRREGQTMVLDFPVRAPSPCEPLPELSRALGAEPRELHRCASGYLAVFDEEREVAALDPDMRALVQDCVIATAPGTTVDFVSRFFAPGKGIDEDPVTGSAHCTLAPYWGARLDKRTLEARQISRRGGALSCRLEGDRVHIAGGAALYMRGTIFVPEHP
jgi:PhzF family phenazine biosynthesis protein